MSKKPQVVVMGGGTGSYVVASGLATQPVAVTMLMTMVDDGGSNKTIRDEFGLLPTSGIRQAIVALSKNQTMLRKLFTYRYSRGGEGLQGMTFGNLFMAAMADITGSQKTGIKETCQLLQVEGEILPMSYDDVQLVAEYEDGSQVIGEHQIDEPNHDGTLKITQLATKPSAQINPAASKALLKADLIIIGPGDLYGNTIANLIVKGTVEALKKSSAKLLFITNLMTKYGETYNYTQADFFQDLRQYLPLKLIDAVLINNNQDFPTQTLERYDQEKNQPMEDNLKKELLHERVKIIRQDLLSQHIPQPQVADKIKRSVIRHDPNLLARAIMDLI